MELLHEAFFVTLAEYNTLRYIIILYTGLLCYIEFPLLLLLYLHRVFMYTEVGVKEKGKGEHTK